MTTAASPRPTVLLDRDGVINEDRPGSVLSAADFALIPGSLEAMVALSRAGYAVVVVTNQACIGRGDVPAAVIAGIHDRLCAEVAAAGGRIEHIFVASATDPADPDRKPNPGLIHRAHAALGFDPAVTWMVGDDSRDVLAARRGGVRPALVLTGKGRSASAAHPDVPAFTDLLAFARALTSGRIDSCFAAMLAEHNGVAAASAALAPAVDAVAGRLAEVLRGGGRLLWCGNGGSAADCQHLAAEFVVRFERDRPGLAAIALTTDTSILTAGANDFGYDQVFRRQVEALGRPGDALIAISTSGNSPSILAAAAAARERGLLTIGLTGGDGGKLAAACEVLLAVPSRRTARIQEMHILIGHTLCGLVDEILKKS